MWVRGLKQQEGGRGRLPLRVAPHVGAWIETLRRWTLSRTPWSHPMWVRGLKQQWEKMVVYAIWSHPMWVRGLKLGIRILTRGNLVSHPMWVRGLKLTASSHAERGAGRTPCGCVD